MRPLVHAPHGAAAPEEWLDAVVVGLAGLALIAYITGVAVAGRRGRTWPAHRTVLWSAGVCVATAGTIGPLAVAARESFTAHMWAHLMTGMIAPVLLVMSAPFTLALRSLAVTPARRLSALLRSIPARIVANPVTGLALTSGGLWLLYTTQLLSSAHADPLVHLAVHGHLVVAGFVFTAAVIAIDPRAHPWPRPALAVALFLSMASHAVLAKYVYAQPPPGIAAREAQAGAELMYYAGGWVEAVVVLIFCAQWYRAAGRRRPAPGSAAAAGGAEDRPAESEEPERGDQPRTHHEQRIHPGVLEVDAPAPES